MSGLPHIGLEEIMPPRLGTIEPSLFPDEEFDLYSIPAFDLGEPEVLEGSQIGSAKQVVQPGDVLLSRIVPHIRRAWVVGENRGRRIIASGEWIVFRGESIEPRYLRHVLMSDPFHSEFMRTVSGVGGSLLRARPAYVAKIRIPLPPLPDQRRIAAILDKADELRAKRRAALKKLDELTQSIFLDMFGDPATNPKGWPRLPIGEVTDSASNWNPNYCPATEFVYIDIAAIDQVRKRIIGARQMLGSEAPSRARQLIRAGDVLVSTVRPNLNAVAKVPDYLEGATASTGFCVLRPRKTRINSDYLFALVRGAAFIDAMVRQATGASYPAVTDQIVRAWMAPCPPLALQSEYARRVTAILQAQTFGDASLEEMENLFTSLQHRAFRGEL
jgi:type I restriction enzyme S subunit